MRINNKCLKRIMFPILCFLAIHGVTIARAGGSGGRSRSSSGGGDGGDLLYLAFRLLFPFDRNGFNPFKFALLVIVITGVYFYHKTKKSNGKTARIIRNQMDSFQPVYEEKADIIENVYSYQLNDDHYKFLVKAIKAFNDIQKAWVNQNLSEVRRYISDSVYQRFTTQFMMMKELNLKNIITQSQIIDYKISEYQDDGLYEVLHIGIKAYQVDKFYSDDYRELNTMGKEEFIEYWSFIKKISKKEYDLYNSNNCPSCGAGLPTDGREIIKCEHCGVITNQGEFDWILAEITQSEDRLFEAAGKDKRLDQKILQIRERDADFSVQMVEDKVSNGYLQILRAVSNKKPEIARRFVSDELFDKIKKAEEKFIYYRIYLNNVTLVDIKSEADLDVLYVNVKLTYQRVKKEDGKLIFLDNDMTHETNTIELKRKKDAIKPVGLLYSHSCPNCGGPLEDTTDIHCPYCGCEVTSPEYEWIITKIMSTFEFKNPELFANMDKFEV